MWIEFPGDPNFELNSKGEIRRPGSDAVISQCTMYAKCFARTTGLPMPSAPAPRVKRPRKVAPEPRERRKRMKLSDDQVQAIRSADGTGKAIAARFGISIAHVSRLRNGKSRKEVA